MDKHAITSVPIHPLIAERWSPRSFDETAALSDNDLLALLEAARWAPSASNHQPWRFVVGRRGDDVFKALHANLMGFNQAWTPRASALILVFVTNQTSDGKPLRTAHLDAGLAVSLLAIQAQALGLHAHPMAGFNHEEIGAALGLPSGLEPLVMVAVGTKAPAEQLEGKAYERELEPRTRLPLTGIVLKGLPA